jgi:hypothetical protein
MSTDRVRAPGSATYRGKVLEDVLGQVMGPTTYGTYLIATSVTYDYASDTTRVTFSHPTDEDMSGAFASAVSA